MEDVTQTYEIDELEVNELGRLYSELQDTEVGTEEYKDILNAIKIIKGCFNDGGKFYLEREKLEQEKALKTEEFLIKKEELRQEKERLEQERLLKEQELKNQKKDMISKIALTVGGTAVTALMWWGTLKFNVNLGSITTKDALVYILGKRKSF